MMWNVVVGFCDLNLQLFDIYGGVLIGVLLIGHIQAHGILKLRELPLECGTNMIVTVVESFLKSGRSFSCGVPNDGI